MSLVRITNLGNLPLEVVSERIVDDGRERFQNGVDVVAPGESQDFVIHARQSVRVVEPVSEQLPSTQSAAEVQS